MSFADKQTLDDLNLLGRYKNQSVLRLFDHTVTKGGQKLMDEMFYHPLTEHVAINKRSEIFKYFGVKNIPLPFTQDEFAVMENYLSSGSFNNRIQATIYIVQKKILQVAGNDKEFELLETDIIKTIDLLNRFRNFFQHFLPDNGPYKEKLAIVSNIYNKLSWLPMAWGIKKLSFAQVAKYDYLLRAALGNEMEQLMAVIFDMDVCIAVSQIALQKGFTYAAALPASANRLNVVNLFHPEIENAVGNPVAMSEYGNVIFLTGANMAGKSTFMKSFGIGIYLAHMGFPVPAAQMEFSVKQGIFTSINVPDNLSLGYSHFYAEVLRVKAVAEEVADGKDLVVIFDELFKGTNVKDAYDATLAITAEFAEYKNCLFIISTHITEVGETLQNEGAGNISFAYMPTIMDGARPTYPYKLSKGISNDRHGMVIIENEGILDIIRSGNLK